MNDAIRKLVIPVAAIAAMGYGGAQIAGASGHGPAASPKASVTTPASDGDGETADDAGQQADTPEPGDTPDAAQGKADTPEPGDTPDAAQGKADTPEPGDTPDQPGAADRDD